MKKTQVKQVKNKQESIGIKPLADRVVVKEMSDDASEKTTKSGIIIPVTVNEDKGAKRGTVVALGPGRFEDGKIVPPTLALGDEVLYSWGEKISIDGSDYTIVREGDVIAVIK